jgi:hypothetical protein
MFELQEICILNLIHRLTTKQNDRLCLKKRPTKAYEHQLYDKKGFFLEIKVSRVKIFTINSKISPR